MPNGSTAEGYQRDARGHRGTRAVRRLVEYAPASGALALWMRHRDVDVPPASAAARFAERDGDDWLVGNDGTTIWYGPAFEGRSLEAQTGLVAHQVLHVALRHVPRERELRGVLGDVDPELYNLCADAIVDAALSHLEWLALPPGAVPLDTVLERLLGERTGAGAALLRWDTESLYRAIDDREPSRGASTRPDARTAPSGAGGEEDDASAGGDDTSGDAAADGDGRGEAGRDDAEARTARGATRADGPIAKAARELVGERAPDLFPGADDTPEREASEAREWSERLTRAHASDASQSILRELLADRPMPRTPWEPLLRTRLARALAADPAPSWSRPTRSWLANRGRTANGRRLPWQPGTSASRPAPRLCVVLDVSGSVDARLLGRFSRELDRLMRVHRAEIHVIAGDDRVRHRARLRPGAGTLSALAVEGGGGTDFVPLLAAADEHRPDLVIVLTDLEGRAGAEPRWPVLWAVPASAGDRPVPFGRTIVLD